MLPTSVVVSPAEPGAAAQWCTPVGCVTPVVAGVVAVLVGLLAALAVVGLTYLPDARQRVAEERDRTRAEREAFGKFADRVSGLGVHQPATGTRQAAGAVAVDASPEGATTREVRRAYRETVMAIDHYDQEYDEPLSAHLRAEVGAEVATAVTEDQPVTPQLREAVVGRAHRTADARETLLDTLADEADALAAAADRLSRVEAALADVRPVNGNWPFEPLADAYWGLADHRDTCRDLLDRRQATLAEDTRLAGDAFDLAVYLYDPLPVRHPVLAEGTERLDDVRTTRTDLARAIGTR